MVKAAATGKASVRIVTIALEALSAQSALLASSARTVRRCATPLKLATVEDGAHKLASVYAIVHGQVYRARDTLQGFLAQTQSQT